MKYTTHNIYIKICIISTSNYNKTRLLSWGMDHLKDTNSCTTIIKRHRTEQNGQI